MNSHKSRPIRICYQELLGDPETNVNILETIEVPVLTAEPIITLNAFRENLGLGPSKNLISSPAYDARLRQPSSHLRSPPPCVSPAAAESRVCQEPHRHGRERSSPAYQGDPNLPGNRCAPIPDEQNCRLWITGLPAECTVHQLLGKIEGVGPVYACHVNAPILSGPKRCSTAAASLTFFTADAATRFLNESKKKPFAVDGCETSIMRHRIKTESVPVSGRSRVLLIVGDPDIVRIETLAFLFSEIWHIRFDTDHVLFMPSEQEGGRNKVVWAFGSFRAQAQVIFTNVNRYFEGRAFALYQSDPCS
jgi:hypothetical protein